MLKTLSIAFAINALMGTGVQSVFSNVNQKMATLSASSAKLQERQRELAPYFYANASAARQYGAELQKVTADIVKINKQVVSQSWSQAGEKWSEFFSGIKKVGAASAPLWLMINTAMDFEAVMSKVGAITGASAEEMAKLNAKARELGASTQFTASQAGEAMTYLGMAGWKTNQIIAGMPGLLSLAAAGGTDLARTADIVSDDLTAFGLGAEQAGHMADVFARVITSTNTNVEMLGETMKYAAPVAHAFGATLEETSAMAGLMANAGIKASQAGTALRAGFLRLAGPPKKSAKEMAALGIELSDATREQAEAAAALADLGITMDETAPAGRKMANIIRQISERTKDLGQEGKLASLQAIFGTTAASGWLAVINQGPDELEKLTASLEKSDGAADEMAKRMRDNANGALIAMKSAVESAAISVGSAFLPIVRSGAEGISKFSAECAKWAGENPETVSQLGQLAASLAGAYLYIKLSTALSTTYRAVIVSLTAAKAAYTAIINAQTLATGKLTAVQKIATLAQWAWNAALSANPIGVVIMGIAGLVAVMRIVYDNCTSISVAWDNWWASMEASYPIFTSVINGIFSLLSGPYRLICAIVDKVKEVIGLGPVDVSASAGMRAIRENATGGIYGKGAFLTTFAEDSGESAIPHTPNARNIGLLARTNEIMGNPLGGNNYNISIPITVNGSADSGAAQDMAARVEAAVRQALDNINNQQRRVSYA